MEKESIVDYKLLEKKSIMYYRQYYYQILEKESIVYCKLLEKRSITYCRQSTHCIYCKQTIREKKYSTHYSLYIYKTTDCYINY